MTTTQATRIQIYRNDMTGYVLTTVVDIAGVIHVTDSEGFHATTVDPAGVQPIVWQRVLLFDARPWQPPAPQMTSPLTPAARVRPTNLAGPYGTMKMTTPQARAVRFAVEHCDGYVFRGGSAHEMSAPSLRAMERRGWLQLDNRVRPHYGRVTPHGRKALERFDTTR